ncbi:hypothetical protein RJ641_016711 [Dillenia turbinata]|uniref:Protein ABIL1 n=1 Tax=Dillenia turbinata TaxID=194707 RepID=A0AAN8USB7_9MAGN
MVDLEQSRTETPMTFDEVSMERSKSFVKALQELKNLRPQLYSAAEYCEKSYLNSEQKQMVLDNLKDYAVRALVNAVDHLGTVAYKLTDLLEQQTSDVSTMELKVSCLNQQLLTCQIYMDKEGHREQQLLAFIPRHHKHYILPNTPASRTLSWHLASETKSTLKDPLALRSNEDLKSSGKAAGAFHLMDVEESVRTKASAGQAQLSSGSPASSAIMQNFGVSWRGSLEGSKPMTAYRSFDSSNRQIIRAPTRSKSMYEHKF